MQEEPNKKSTIAYPEEEIADLKKRSIIVNTQMQKELGPLKLTNRDKANFDNNLKTLEDVNSQATPTASPNFYKKTRFAASVTRRGAPGLVFTKVSCLYPPKVYPERKKLLVVKDKEKHWDCVRPYYNYCEYCEDRNYKYGSLLYKKDTERIKVDWSKAFDRSDFS